MKQVLSKNQFEVLVVIERDGGKKITQRNIAELTHLSLGAVNKVYTKLIEAGYVDVDNNKVVTISELGKKVLEPYRVKRAIILAAGFGSRMVPITLNTPKPLVHVYGKRIIETLLEAINLAEIEEVIVVRGYLAEQFDVLIDKYPNIKFVHNQFYNESNNISSATLISEYLSNSYVMEADLLVSNYNLIRKYEYSSNYLAKYVEYTNDWCFNVKNGYIKEVMIGGRECHHMYGISYWTAEDGVKLGKCLVEGFNSPGGKELYWDEIPLKMYKNRFKVGIRLCNEGEIVEIDTFKELREIDPIYNMI